MKQQITIESEITVEFDENSEDFKNLFENYNLHFQECDLEEFSEIIATTVLRDGARVSIEGIGLVKINGNMQRESYFPATEEINHPVNVVFDEDMNGHVDSFISGNESVK